MESKKRRVYDFTKYPVEVYFNLEKKFTLSGVYESFIDNEKEFIRAIMYDNGIDKARDYSYDVHSMFKGTKVCGYSLRKAISFRNNSKLETS